MPAILALDDYVRWLGEERDPRDLMPSYPAELMWMWPISTRVNKPFEPGQLAHAVAVASNPT
jgi:putative SOS response-associated peptidase YedK